ncbi:MAG: hypothetical protein COW84_07940 [Gammaproteobacteria bacterium CG22_combo_CG10-13_8_21_14_all_40_8]|nr:MAG: hypothetical protein COW84_07940 [Gammaproteobacteria bacterium CG22_combo_CG10-13_8_21_14_all_40_8]
MAVSIQRINLPTSKSRKVLSGTLPESTVLNSHSVLEQLQNDNASLNSAFEQFSRLGKEIVKSYSSMEQQVEILNEELEWVTNQRIKEFEEKKALASRLQQLLNILPSAVIVIDGKGRITQVNPVAEMLLGEKLDNKTWSQVVHEKFQNRTDNGIETSLKDGTRLHVATCPLSFESGQLVVLTDVTSMHKLQNMVVRNKRLASIGKAMASLSHQLRTPLSSAMIYSSHLKKEEIAYSARNDMATKLQNSLNRMNSQIEDMLMFARGGMDQAKRFSINDWWQELSEQLEEMSKTRSIPIQISLDCSSSGFLYANSKALTEAVLNLAVNACDAVQSAPIKKPQVKVQAKIQKKELIIKVSDNGTGVSESVANELFDPFISCKPKGTGLGLAIVQAIVVSIGGKICWSNNTSAGATFSMVLPLAKELQSNPYTVQSCQKTVGTQPENFLTMNEVDVNQGFQEEQKI